MSITRTTGDRQYEHIGNIRHGVQTGPWRVEFDAPVANATGYDKIYQGTIVSLDANGQYILGCGEGTTTNKPVPFMSMKNVFDPDVTTGLAGRNISVTVSDSAGSSGTAVETIPNPNTSVISAVGGKITAIPLTCGYELETTEFDLSVADWQVNDGLTVNSDGKLVKATAAPGGTEPWLGTVSIAPGTYVNIPDRNDGRDYLGNMRLAFFANFIPANFA